MEIKELLTLPRYAPDDDYTAVACCFTGNRPQKLPWGSDESDARCQSFILALNAQLRLLIDSGYTYFISGMALGGDLAFAREVIKLRKQYPHIKLECAVPCPEQSRAWNDEQKNAYKSVLIEADYITVVSDKYTKWCMHQRNRYMVDKSSIVIALSYCESGGTAYTMQYAQKNGKKVVNLA